jgi:hypothetical protein
MIARHGKGNALLLLLAASLIACPSRTTAPSPTDAPSADSSTRDASEILHRMAERYASARLYEDSGIAIDVDLPDDGGSEGSRSRIEFETDYDRVGGGFRFAYRKTYERFFAPDWRVISREGKGPVRLMEKRGPDATKTYDLQAAAGAIAGVSSGTSEYVPQMLLGAPCDYARGDEGLSYRTDGEEVVNGVPCVRLSAGRGERTVILWIAKVDHSLRKRFDHNRLGEQPMAEDAIESAVAYVPQEQREEEAARLRSPRPFVAEQTVEWTPVFDRPIDPARFTNPLPPR